MPKVALCNVQLGENSGMSDGLYLTPSFEIQRKGKELFGFASSKTELHAADIKVG